MDTGLTEIRNDLNKELKNVTAEEMETNPAREIEEDFISLDTARALMQLKDGVTVALVARGTSENAAILIRDTLKTDEEDTIRYRRLIQRYIRNKFPHWVDKLKKITDSDLAFILMSEMMKIGAAINIREEDKQIKENPNALSKFFAVLRNIFFFVKKPESKKGA